MRLVLLNKPYRVLSAFTDLRGRETLAACVDIPDVYPAGRLDYDSEGLLAITDDGRLQAAIADPRHKLPKTYYAQVEGIVAADALTRLRDGIDVRGHTARALDASAVEEPEWLWPRNPPIRYRQSVPDAWLRITIDEGRNRQVRRMGAAVGLPVLRLIRTRIGPWEVHGLQPGEYRDIPTRKAWPMLRRFRR